MATSHVGLSCSEGGIKISGSPRWLLAFRLALDLQVILMFSGPRTIQANAYLLDVCHVLWTVRGVKINNNHRKTSSEARRYLFLRGLQMLGS